MLKLIDRPYLCNTQNHPTRDIWDELLSVKYTQRRKKILVAKTLKEYINLLPASDFIRTHQSHFVNRSYVKSWINDDGPKLLMIDGTKIPISRLNRERIKQFLQG